MAMNGRVLKILARPAHATPTTRLGSHYGGWWIPQGVLDQSSICYLAGVGEDASFDVALSRHLNCKVWAMDPTPRSIEFSRSLPPEQIEFLPVGLWDEDQKIKLYGPRNESHVSHSALNIQATERFIEAEVRTVATLMRQLGHDHLDLLKLDIEGAEMRVIDNMFADEIHPKVLCVEFDEPEGPLRTMKKIGRICNHGYQIAHVEKRNYTFVHSSATCR
jgi:FkbM family methyltransferase